MTISVTIDLGCEPDVKASAQAVLDLLSDVPTPAERY